MESEILQLQYSAILNAAILPTLHRLAKDSTCCSKPIRQGCPNKATPRRKLGFPSEVAYYLERRLSQSRLVKSYHDVSWFCFLLGYKLIISCYLPKLGMYLGIINKILSKFF